MEEGTGKWKAYRSGSGDVAQLVERRTDTPLRQIRFPGAARDFSPGVRFSADSLTVSVQPSCAIACINICAHVTDPHHLQPIPLFGHTKIPRALLGTGSAALAAAVALLR